MHQAWQKLVLSEGWGFFCSAQPNSKDQLAKPNMSNVSSFRSRVGQTFVLFINTCFDSDYLVHEIWMFVNIPATQWWSLKTLLLQISSLYTHVSLQGRDLHCMNIFMDERSTLITNGSLFVVCLFITPVTVW